MALGALIGAYQEDDSGGLAALLPLAGRTLIEYQVRCAAAAGASPIVVLVERIPLALNQAFERLRQEGLAVVPVSDGAEAATRFEASELILLIGDGIAAPLELLLRLGHEHEALVLTVPDDEAHENFERIDSVSRWSGVALIDGRMLGATAAMLGDWDLPSTLLRRSLQAGARLQAATSGNEPLLARNSGALEQFERSLIAASRSERTDLASRYVLPPVEDFATEKLMETGVRAEWLLYLALALTVGAAFAFTRGWLWPAVITLVLSSPLDLVARRLGILRLRPIPPKTYSQLLLWPAGGLALIALSWWETRHGAGWGALVCALSAAAFAQAYQVERAHTDIALPPWLVSRRNTIFLLLLFAIGQAWTGFLVAVLVYTSVSFFFVQYLVHRVRTELTPH
ncbi:hypothetical protein [Sphingomonas daechungensis]|uniref:hypothetical protein n=1 Tax=Sphingomonas daechungensis TaxID=1176646 RepID=UPI0031E96961